MPLPPSTSLPHLNALSHSKKLFSSDGAHEIASVVAIRSQAINNEPFKISSPLSFGVRNSITSSAAKLWDRISALACCWYEHAWRARARAPAHSAQYQHDFLASIGKNLLSEREQKPQLEGVGSEPGCLLSTQRLC